MGAEGLRGPDDRGEPALRAPHPEGQKNVKGDYERVYTLLPAPEGTSQGLAGYLSGGEQQMLAIGRALMARPKLMLLDEPSLGLSPLLVKEIFGIIKDINQKEKTTILLVEQNAGVALSISSYGYIMGKRQGGARRRDG